MMKNTAKKTLLALCLLPSIIWGITFESDRIADVISQANADTWVIFDVDNTLIESAIQLGSVPWRDHIRNKAKQAGYDASQSEWVLDKFWIFVHSFTPVEIVDKATRPTIQQLQESKIPILALTAREPIEAANTQRQLNSVKIILSNNTFRKNYNLTLPHPCLYEEGVIYCGENTKSEGLLAFFKETGMIPKKVVFIDDRWEQVRNLEKTLKQQNIEFVGIRFSGADKHVQAFDGAIADLQWCHLPKILTDKEAQKLLDQSTR
jgi:hypothetical protein